MDKKTDCISTSYQCKVTIKNYITKHHLVKV